MEKAYIDADLCKKCGGKCCKKSGCSFLPQDFERMSYNYLLEKLNEGYISIVAELHFDIDKNERMYWTPFLSLKIRNNNRGIVDLVSYKSGCSILTENGCPLSENERPSMALTLKPMPNLECYQMIEHSEIKMAWGRYQDVLSRLVTYFTHKSVEEAIEEDMTKLKEFLEIRALKPNPFDEEESELRYVMNLYEQSYYLKESSSLTKSKKKKRKK